MIKKNVYSVKSISIDSVISCVLAGISFICQVAAIIMSYVYEGKGPKVVGILGFAGFLMAFTGVKSDIRSLCQIKNPIKQRYIGITRLRRFL